MNWFQGVLKALKIRATSYWSDKLSWGGLIGPGLMPSAGIMVSPDRALSLTAYYAAVHRISTDTASLPLVVYRRRKSGGRDLATNHRLTEVLGVSPDGEATSLQWRQAQMGHVLGWGNSYAEIESDRGGRVLKLHLLDPSTTRAARRGDGKLVYRFDGPEQKSVDPSRILHVAGLGFNALEGYSVAKYHAEAIGTALAAERAGGAFFGNGSRPSGVLELPYKLENEEAVERLRRTWGMKYGGVDNHGSVPILEGGAKFTPMSIPPQDAQYIQTRQFQVIEIARMFGIPPHKIGDYSQTGSAYRALEEANLDYLITTIRPWCEVIEQQYEFKLLTARERAAGYHVEHDMSAYLRGDSKSRSAYYTSLFALAVLTPNQIRECEGMNPIGPDGDTRYLSNQYTPAEALEPDGQPDEPETQDQPLAQPDPPPADPLETEPDS